MIDRVCISINNECNLSCAYCHFGQKKETIIPCNMDVFVILDNIQDYIKQNGIKKFKIGFVGNGEPFLDFDMLCRYIIYIDDLIIEGVISAYTITNGTCLDAHMLEFMRDHMVNVGFSIDGPREIHDKYRSDSFDDVMKSINLYRIINGRYPTLNCTVGRDALLDPDLIVSFFQPFDSRITFSRMIGIGGISLSEYREFMRKMQGRLNVRMGGYDCTMYGGMCGAGINNVFYSNNRIYICGNCIDLKSLPYDTPLDKIDFSLASFDRHYCYKETVGT